MFVADKARYKVDALALRFGTTRSVPIGVMHTAGG